VRMLLSTQHRKVYMKNLLFTTATGEFYSVALRTSDFSQLKTIFGGHTVLLPAYRLLHSSVRKDGRRIL
jgi:hypothetical protein